MNTRKILIIAISIVCVFAVGYGIYFQVFVRNAIDVNDTTQEWGTNEKALVQELDSLFDNQINYQNNNFNTNNKIDQAKDIVYATYTLNEIYEGKYSITADIPMININTEKAININKEITAKFKDKLDSIIANSNKQDNIMTRYTVQYTAYINQNILSLVIKSTLKEGSNAQRLIIQAYTYNLSTNEEISLADMLELKGINQTGVKREIKRVVQEGISRAENLVAIGYNVYERDINSKLYEIENSNNYFLGPNGTIYIIYAYGNSYHTSESDVVMIE